MWCSLGLICQVVSSTISVDKMMNTKSIGTVQRDQKMKQAQQERPNWVLIAGGALLSTLSIRLVCVLKQSFETRRSNNSNKTTKGNGKAAARRRLGACELHANLYCFPEDEDGCYRCLSGSQDGAVNNQQAPASPVSKEADFPLPLVKISTAESNKDNGGVMWASSPDCLELPHKPLYHSNCSDSPCVSESGSDIYSRREVIQKLRQQLKRRDEMIMEMQAQIADLQNSLTIQMSQSAHLQSQIDSANRDLFDSEREIQRLRKAIADHCLAGMTGSPGKPVANRNWQPEGMNGHVNGCLNGECELELHCVGVENGRGDSERVEMLKREVGELKEVIEGKEFLIQSYKEQKVELCSKIKELQQRLASQVPNIL